MSFAHRGEAQFFLEDKHTQWHRHPQFDFLYQSLNYDLILTGEGVFDALHRLSLVLGFNAKAYSQVINLGVAGSLSSLAKLGSIYPIRTCYLFHQDQMQFQSFLQEQGQLDCVTHFDRVLASKYKKPLEGFAHIVDRELWAVAKACQTFYLPWQSYKLITDLADESTGCQLIFESRIEWSQQLKTFFELQMQSSLKPIDSLPLVADSCWERAWLEHAQLHWTESLRQEFKNLMLQNPQLKNELTHNAEISELLQKKSLTPKTRVIYLLDILRSIAQPLIHQYKQQRINYQNLGKQYGIEIQFDPKGENLELLYKFSTSNQKGLMRKIEALQQLSQAQSLDEM